MTTYTTVVPADWAVGAGRTVTVTVPVTVGTGGGATTKVDRFTTLVVSPVPVGTGSAHVDPASTWAAWPHQNKDGSNGGSATSSKGPAATTATGTGAGPQSWNAWSASVASGTSFASGYGQNGSPAAASAKKPAATIGTASAAASQSWSAWSSDVAAGVAAASTHGENGSTGRPAAPTSVPGEPWNTWSSGAASETGSGLQPTATDVQGVEAYKGAAAAGPSAAGKTFVVLAAAVAGFAVLL